MHATTMVAAVIALLAWFAPQDPEKTQDPDKRPRPPADAKPLAPVREPFRSAVERKDLLQRFAKPSPIEGIYELRSYERPGFPTIDARGYLCIGRRYLSVQLVGMTPNVPVLQAGFRGYRIQQGRLYMTNLLGFRADNDETWRLEPVGMTINCGFRVIGTKLTMTLDNGHILDFLRIE